MFQVRSPDDKNAGRLVHLLRLRQQLTRIEGPMTCPRCTACMGPAGSDWHRCLGCGYEIQDDAARLYVDLVAAFEEDPGRFFENVRRHRDTVRALEPVWQRQV